MQFNTEICRGLLEKHFYQSPNINIHKKEVWSLYIFFQNYNTQMGTGKFTYNALILDEKQLLLKWDQSGSHKVPSSTWTLITFEIVLLLTNNKR